MKNIVFKTSILLIIFIYGVTVGVFHFFPYNHLKDSYQVLKSISSPQYNDVNLKNCNIEKTKKIFSESTIIIGHAYGDPGKSDKLRYLTNDVENFLETHRDKITRVIFTGDVFYEPSLEKWNRLHKQFKNSFDIYIAPGNHDVGSLSSADVFQLSDFSFLDSRPVPEDHSLIIEDSISNNWLLSNKTLDLIKNHNKSTTFLFRHNIPIKELLKYANSYDFMSENLPEVKNFVKPFSNLENFVIISGDSGAPAQRDHPRLTCNKFQNITFITNGVGEIDGDIILVLKDNKILYFELSSSSA